MAFREANTLLLALIWMTVFRVSLGSHHFTPRIKVNRENGAFLTINTSNGHMIGNLTLIQDSHRVNIYAGGPQGLFMFDPRIKHPTLTKVKLPILEPECMNSSTNCKYEISMLKEGRNGNPLFLCRTTEHHTNCCDVERLGISSSEHKQVNCFILRYPTQINEPSVHVDDSLYYTISDLGTDFPSGLYRETRDKYIFPLAREIEQRHVKILANKGNGSLDGKVYSFYIEKNQNQNSDLPQWIPRVSQICMADLGGSKAMLQFRWTSMLTARLFCGDEKKRLSYTELLDVAVLEATEWENTMIYTLFKNTYNLRAVCIYKMSDIIRVFTSNTFTAAEKEPFSSPRPGECVQNSPTLSSNILKFMDSLPELEQWIKPVRDPVVFENNYHYTHIQVDTLVNRKSGHSHHVLFMSLDNGNVHKILDQEDKPFIIAEYKLFKSRTHINSMLLDRVTKKLFVSSSTEVVQIDLSNCSIYGKDCKSCVIARDPYCSWDSEECSADDRSSIQDVTHGSHTTCDDGVPRTDRFRGEGKTDVPESVPQYSKYYLKCPVESYHASYSWHHQDSRKDCVSTEHGCLLLIDSMSEKDEGDYQCIASENGYQKTLVHQKLQMNGASETRATRVSLACLLFLISVIC
ncbi:semaphorin-7A-like [Tachysurus fulvidraco]|uniref:semaphorin-7A-like n=1 Tax=Tachysurus fulvidraco TaxID=1234273 RepID=UPI001FEE8775|nr:semaphorin-7A-like [Tachysurus fulvidraco]